MVAMCTPGHHLDTILVPPMHHMGTSWAPAVHRLGIAWAPPGHHLGTAWALPRVNNIHNCIIHKPHLINLMVDDRTV